jgi:hypothetical protein
MRSALAFIVEYADLAACSGFDQNGTRRHQAMTSSRPLPAGRTIGMMSVGATL